MGKSHLARHQVKVVRQMGLALAIDSAFFILAHQRCGDTKHRIAGEVVITIGKHLRDEHFVTWRGHHEMQMGRPVGVAQLSAQ